MNGIQRLQICKTRIYGNSKDKDGVVLQVMRK